MDNKRSSKDQTLVYIYSETPDYVRVDKLLPLLSSIFKEVHYIGCKRSSHFNKQPTIANVHYHIYPKLLSHGGLKSIFSGLGFLRYIREELKLIRPDVVLSTNEEFVLPFCFMFFPRPKLLFCDLTDSLAIRMGGPLRHLNWLWGAFSYIAKKEVDGLVEVSDERYMRHRFLPENTVVIYNSPLHRKILPDLPITEDFIYVNGSFLDEVSGLESLLEAVERQGSLHIVAAGRPVGSWTKDVFIKHPKVTFLGRLTNDESLRVAAASKAIFAHYKPFITNYVYAAPNKFFDAMMLGVPLIINSECKPSQAAKRLGFGVVNEFNNVDALTENITALANGCACSKQELLEAKQRFEDEYSWQCMSVRWIDFFEKNMGVKIV